MFIIPHTKQLSSLRWIKKKHTNNFAIVRALQINAMFVLRVATFGFILLETKFHNAAISLDILFTKRTI